MVRGCEKRVVRLQNPDSRVFEEVLFVLRDEAARPPMAERDIVAEANRILRENTARAEKAKKAEGPLLPFLLGVALASALLVPLFFWL